MIDIPTQYCERLVTGGFEPINTISNIAFFVAALLAFWTVRKHESSLKYILPLLLASVGIGSALWHAQHSHLGDIADTGTIIIFASVAAVLLLRKLFKNTIFLGAVFIILLGFTLYVEQLTYLNGSLPYLVLLIGFGFACIAYIRKFPNSRRLLIRAWSTFAFAILFRVVDPVVCNLFPIGTHFLWHVLIAALGYQLILLVLKNQ